MFQVLAKGLVEKIIKAVRDLADAMTPRPALVPIPIPVRDPAPRVRR